jgi:hypothetical protein
LCLRGGVLVCKFIIIMSIMKIVVVIELHNRAANTLHQKLLPVLEEAEDELDPVQLCGITAMLGDY